MFVKTSRMLFRGQGCHGAHSSRAGVRRASAASGSAAGSAASARQPSASRRRTSSVGSSAAGRPSAAAASGAQRRSAAGLRHAALLVDQALQAVGEVAGQRLEQAGHLDERAPGSAPASRASSSSRGGTSARASTSAALSRRRAQQRRPCTTRFGLVLAKSRSALAARRRRASPLATKAIAVGPGEQLLELASRRRGRRGGPACSCRSCTRRRRPQCPPQLGHRAARRARGTR